MQSLVLAPKERLQTSEGLPSHSLLVVHYSMNPHLQAYNELQTMGYSLVVVEMVFAASPVSVELTVVTVAAARASSVDDADVSVTLRRFCSVDVALISAFSWSVVS